MQNFIKLSVVAIASALLSYYDKYVGVLCCVLVSICFDVITGLVRCKITGEVLSSKIGIIGFWKKLALLLALFFGIFLDIYIPVLVGMVAVNIPFSLPFGTFIGCYIVLNENISILENLNRSGVILPKWLKSFFKESKNTLDGKKVNK